jgi:hypothetical protein
LWRRRTVRYPRTSGVVASGKTCSSGCPLEPAGFRRCGNASRISTSTYDCGVAGQSRRHQRVS